MGGNTLALHNLPINYMTDEDREIFKAAVVDVLERGRDGETMRWENPKTGAHGDLTSARELQKRWPTLP